MLGGGGTGTTPRSRLGRLNPDGSLDPASIRGPTLRAGRHLQVDGKILVGGGFTMLGGGGTGTTTRAYLGRLDATARSIRRSIRQRTATSTPCPAAGREDPGRRQLHGAEPRLKVTTRNHIGRLNGDGSLDATFDPGREQYRVRHRCAAGREDPASAGFSRRSARDPLTRNRIARLNTDGTLDAFDPGADGGVYRAGGAAGWEDSGRRQLHHAGRRGSA